MFVLAAALLLAACNPAEKLMNQVQNGGVGYVTVKDKKVPGRYQAEASVDPAKGNDSGDVALQALLNGLEEVQKDGYDLVIYSGPRRGTLTKTITTVQRYSPSSSYVAAQYPAIVYDVQGYKSIGDHPPNARPIAAVIAQVTADREKRRAVRAAVGSITTQK
jgi:hypothetical protein